MSSRKNILLVHPWIYDFTAFDFWLKPLGLMYMAALLLRYAECDLFFIDCLDHGSRQPDGRGAFSKEEVKKPAVLEHIPRKYSRYGITVPRFRHELGRIPRPDAVLITCTMTYWYPGVQAVVDILRRTFGSVPILLGGVYATLLPDHARSATGVDVVCSGPGERKLLPLIREILGDGVCPSLRLRALEEMPFPAHDLLLSRDSFPLLTSRGCPMACSFCASRLINEKWEQRSPASVLGELEVLCRLNGKVNVALYDDALLLDKERHLFPILEEVIRRRLSLSFHTPNGLHVREIDRPTARLLRESGFRSLFLSQETFNEELMERACAKASSGDLERALDHLEKAGYERREVNVYLLAGIPGQDFASVREAVLGVLRLGARPRLAYFSPVPGTRDWERMVDEGILKRDGDPLLHNKLVFPYTWSVIGPEELRLLKALAGSKPGKNSGVIPG